MLFVYKLFLVILVSSYSWQVHFQHVNLAQHVGGCVGSRINNKRIFHKKTLIQNVRAVTTFFENLRFLIFGGIWFLIRPWEASKMLRRRQENVIKASTLQSVIKTSTLQRTCINATTVNKSFHDKRHPRNIDD